VNKFFLFYNRTRIFFIKKSLEKIEDLAMWLVEKGNRISDPASQIQTYQKHTTFNGMHATFRVIVDSCDGNRVITIFPVLTGPSIMKISLNIPSDEELPLSGFVLGDMTISGTYGTSSSRDDQCRQMMMVFVSLPLLTFGVQKLLLSQGNKKSYNFIGIESSFNISFKCKNNIIVVESMGKLIDKLTHREIYNNIVDSISNIINDFSQKLCKTDGTYYDLHLARTSFIKYCSPIFTSELKT
jgi:hypothetical protein